MGTDARIFDSTSRTCLYFDRLYNLNPDRYGTRFDDRTREVMTGIFEDMCSGQLVRAVDVMELVLGNQAVAPNDERGSQWSYWNKCVERFVRERPDGRFFIRDEHQYEWPNVMDKSAPEAIQPWPEEHPDELYVEVGREIEGAVRAEAAVIAAMER